MPLKVRPQYSSAKARTNWGSRPRVVEDIDITEDAGSGLGTQAYSQPPAIYVSPHIHRPRTVARHTQALTHHASDRTAAKEGTETHKQQIEHLPLNERLEYVPRATQSEVVPPKSLPARWARNPRGIVTYKNTIDSTTTIEARRSNSSVSSKSTSTHKDQPGRWIFVTDAPYTSHNEWIFIPESTSSVKRATRRQKQKERQQPKIKTTFFSLPGELRNEVYRHIFPARRLLIVCNKPNKENAKRKGLWSEEDVNHKHPRPRLFHMLDVAQVEEGLDVSIDLLLTCKQIKTEVESLLYSQTTFCFSSTKVLTRFLNGASKAGLGVIRKLEILHNGYAHPECTAFHKYREKYYNRWLTVCVQLGSTLLGLEDLKLQASITDWPCELSNIMNMSWWNACRRMAPQGLRKVKIRLRHIMVDGNELLLKDLARSLENDMMTQEGMRERDRLETQQVLDELEARRAEKEARARAREAKRRAAQSNKIITITSEDVKNQNPRPSKVCSAGLEKYARIETSGDGVFG